MASPENAQDDIMPLPLTKQLLALAERGPLGCAFGLTKDKKECLLLIDKRAKPKKVQTLLKNKAKAVLEMPSVRFGRVDIDVKDDPGTVRFTVNRSEAGGTIMTLVKLAKKAGYQAIVINTDEELEHEAEEEDIPEAPPPPPPVAEIDPTALKARLTELVKRMIARIAVDPARKDEMMALAKNAQIMLGTNNLKTATEKADALELILDEPLPEPDEAAQLDALKARVTGLVKRMIARLATDPSHKDEMTGLAKDAQTLLAAKSLEGATGKADALEALLGETGQPGEASARPLGNFVKMQTSRLIWVAARQKVAAELEQFRRVVEADFEGEEDEDEVLDGMEMIDDILLNLDDRLIDVLDDMLDERTPPEEREHLVVEAKKLIGVYESYVNGHPLISSLEGDTPFGLKLSVASTLTKTLQSLKAAVN